MDIRYLSRRNHEIAARSGAREARETADAGQVAAAAQTAQTSTSASQAAATAAVEGTSEQTASSSRFTPTGRLLHVLQSFEQRHPERTQRVLSNIADKLRSDAEHAGVFSERLTRWADRFQAAADSGDMSKLMPRMSSHFGMRAYQQAQQPEADATVEHVAGTAEAQANAAESGATTMASETESRDAGRVSGIHTRPVTVPESATVERESADIRNRPVTVPESATVERESADIRNRPVTVPESATAERNSSDIRNRPVTVPESAKMAVNQ